MNTLLNLNQRRNSFWLLLGLFVVSRIFYRFVLGIEYVYRLDYWQIPDLNWLMDSPWETLLDMHMQPPFLAFMVFAGERIFGDYASVAHQVMFLAMGFLVIWGLFLLLNRYFSFSVALAVSLLFLLDPNNVLFENLFFYSYPSMFFLFGVGFFLLYGTQSNGRLILVSALAALLLLYTRSLFHLVFLLIPVAYLLLSPGNRKYAFYFLIPLVLVGMLYGKNKVIFGKFGTSSWMGMSMSRLMVDHEDKAGLARIDAPQSVKDNRAFSALERYEDVVHEGTNSSHPMLNHLRNTYGASNFNHSQVLALDDAYKQLSIAYLRQHPEYYAKQVVLANIHYLKSPLQYFFYKYEKTGAYFFEKRHHSWGLILPVTDLLGIVFTLTVLLWTIFRLVLMVIQRKIHLHLLLAIAFIGYVMVIGNILEIGENMRFKYLTYPWFYFMLADMIHTWFNRRKSQIIREIQSEQRETYNKDVPDDLSQKSTPPIATLQAQAFSPWN